MKKLIAAILCMLSAVLFIACAQTTTPSAERATPTPATAAHTPTSSPTPTQTETGTGYASAYVAVMDAAIEEILDTTGKTGFVSIDLSQGTAVDAEALYPELDAYFEQQGLQVYHYTLDELIEHGHADAHGQTVEQNGVLLRFADEHSTENQLITELVLHYSLLGGTFTQYTVEKQQNGWVVSDIELIAVA